MSKIVILGAGIAGHTAATHLRRKLGNEHEILVVSPNSNYQWVPSNIWVGVGRMSPNDVKFPLAPLYKKHHIGYKQAKVISFHPEGDVKNAKPYVIAEYVFGDIKGKHEIIDYDFLINATGPKLAFDLTEGLNPGTNKCYSVCSYDHAEHASAAFTNLKLKLKKSTEKVKILIGTGHAKATCQGAAFEYILNVDSELRRCGLREKVEITWISNEYHLGDFGMDGMLLTYGDMIMKSSDMVEMVFEDRDIK